MNRQPKRDENPNGNQYDPRILCLVGVLVGAWVGVQVGVLVGAWVGWVDVGFLDGIAVGTDVGFLVGVLVGAWVGVLVGVLVSACVGWVDIV